ncbi:MAG TPA: hypothetical protein VIK72_14545 [Clostridiaceae bacterium]
MKKKITISDTWYDEYKDREKNQKYEFVLKTMLNPMDEELIQGIDFTDVLISIKEDLIKSHQLHKLKELIESVKQNQPKIYEDSFQYLENTAASYYLYTKDIDSLKESIKIFIKHPSKSIDNLIKLLKNIEYYNEIEIAVSLSKAVFEQISKSTGVMPGAEKQFKYAIYINEIKELYNKVKAKENVSLDEILHRLKEYELDMGKKLFDIFMEAFEANIYSLEALDLNSLKTREADLSKIIWCFADYMLVEKGVNFSLSAHISINLVDLLENNDTEETQKKDASNYFVFSSSWLEDYIDEAFSGLIFQDEAGIAAFLWGIPYFYSFLLKRNLISKSTYKNTLGIIDISKKAFIFRNNKDLWNYDFVHRWEKPDYLSQEEFEGERELFHFEGFADFVANEAEGINSFFDEARGSSKIRKTIKTKKDKAKKKASKAQKRKNRK